METWAPDWEGFLRDAWAIPTVVSYAFREPLKLDDDQVRIAARERGGIEYLLGFYRRQGFGDEFILDRFGNSYARSDVIGMPRKRRQRLFLNPTYQSESGLYGTRLGAHIAAFIFHHRARDPETPFSFTVRAVEGGLILAETTVPGVLADASEEMPRATSTSGYHKIFGSYSRKDIDVVRSVASILKTSGSGELSWDLDFLSAGDVWADVIRDQIQSADSFQLFWSSNARRSPNVEKEWRTALALGRKSFVKPVYWETPIPSVPDALSHLHFSRLDFPYQRKEGLLTRFFRRLSSR